MRGFRPLSDPGPQGCTIHLLADGKRWSVFCRCGWCGGPYRSRGTASSARAAHYTAAHPGIYAQPKVRAS